ncbi:SRPBCC family protein [Aeromicrobium stalagmiti]|uniref:SRPBCC family protein n=1 Tax=Aeromicrobium stalagmiti TaxID=2738988 RepID=UPI001568B35F|nr:SRPBCC family protein [Aeromicrobium stalagmiti]NRQ51195.1 SRPBCC family protein [Aeromicrobium stalagmiti]
MANQQLIDGTIDIDATPATVWGIVSDLRSMGERSPQCRRMFVLGQEIGLGTRTFNLNRQGWKRWPTNAKVVAFEPERRIAFQILENRTVWTYELEPTATGTRLTESRTAPRGVSKVSNVATQRFLGGTDTFEVSLKDGIRRTLEQVKAAAEKA